MYSKVVLNLFSNPKNAGRISKPDGIASLSNADESAHVEFSLRIDMGIIMNCQFRAQANPYIIAICSTITEMVKGKMIAMLFLDETSVKKALGDESDIDINFCIDCIKLAVADYKEKLEKANTIIDPTKPRRGRKPKNLAQDSNDNLNEEAEVVLDDNVLNATEFLVDMNEDDEDAFNESDENTSGEVDFDDFDDDDFGVY